LLCAPVWWGLMGLGMGTDKDKSNKNKRKDESKIPPDDTLIESRKL